MVSRLEQEQQHNAGCNIRQLIQSKPPKSYYSRRKEMDVRYERSSYEVEFRFK